VDVHVLQYLGTDLTNDEKAAVFEQVWFFFSTVSAHVSQTVPCHNNMALCCLKRGKFREASEFSNAVCFLSFLLSFFDSPPRVST
jgi:hypothetical protein